MNESLLAISIPTYNRPEMINFYLKTVYKKTFELGIGVYFYDSSPNKKTENIIKSFQDKGYSNLHYVFLNKLAVEAYEFEINRMELMLSMPKSRYVWICGDKAVPNPSILDSVIKFLKLDYDIVLLSDRDEKKIGFKSYNNHITFFGDVCWELGLLAGTIIKVKYFDNINPRYVYEKYEKYLSFVWIAFFFENMNNSERFRGLYVPIKYRLFWGKAPEPYWADIGPVEIFAWRWVNLIQNLPDSYNKYKSSVQKDHGIYSGMFSFSGLCYFRSVNWINYKLFKRYKKELSEVTNININLILIICILPPKMANTIRNVSNRVYKLVNSYSKPYR